MSDTIPSRDPVRAAARLQARSIDRLWDGLGELSREIAELGNKLDGAIDGFAAQHGNREAAERASAERGARIERQLGVILHELRNFGKRLSENEKEIDDLKAAVLARGSDDSGSNGSNGNGEDHPAG